ncbi:phosphoribosyltransferase [Campylobacter sp. MIT 97-5078]|uniref:phosphoribosyltransferase n=1 Tax=Campylobacter sp. MIT 97-5078 TaxID=1548153 RepID=UPI0005147CCC|nr:phosphoribosyltransferase family protein [Campylobacter sp. MIT 97-5078]KGI55732.1 nicotinate phosphoribosyltransferase [Campylobacter sp. MIT 97-5078]TQR27167.1 nicotinate phosphoribosyltransferase [Campylobacter sp. MIT 97-5078]
MIVYPYEEFEKDVKVLAKQIRSDFNPDAIVAVARGGMTLGHFLAMHINTRLIFTLNSIHYDDTAKLGHIEIFNVPELSKFNKVLIVDDIIDSGETMQEILRILKEKFPNIEFKVASLFYKDQALLEPEFKVKKTDEWIEFFWEKI